MFCLISALHELKFRYRKYYTVSKEPINLFAAKVNVFLIACLLRTAGLQLAPIDWVSRRVTPQPHTGTLFNASCYLFYWFFPC